MNSTTIPACLRRFQLGTDADVRALRRAYGRELKMSDRERDADAFQRLREDHDAALAWLATGGCAVHGMEAHAAQTRAAVDPQGTDAPQCASHAAWDAFIGACKTLHEGSNARDEHAWRSTLVHFLERDDLVNLEARTGFEDDLLRRLADGWKPGHDMLFDAAQAVFRWGIESRSLLRFGDAGAILTEAVDELALFHAQDETEQSEQLLLRQTLRTDIAPDAAIKARDIVLLEWMLATFPVWMALTANPVQIAHWKADYARQRAEAQRKARAAWLIQLQVSMNKDTAEPWRRPDDPSQLRRRAEDRAASHDAQPDDEPPYIPVDAHKMAWKALLYFIAFFAVVILANVLCIVL